MQDNPSHSSATPDATARARNRLIELREHLERISNQAKEHTADLVPSEVKSAYVPSGRSDKRTPWVLGGFALGGIAIGVLCAFVLTVLAKGVFQIFQDIGGCLLIVLIPAMLAFGLSPLAIGYSAAVAIDVGGRRARCRAPKLGHRVGLAAGVIAAVVAVPFTIRLLAGGKWMFEAVLGSKPGDVVTLIWTIVLIAGFWVMYALDGYLWPALMGIGNVLLGWRAGSDAGSEPFCEGTNQYLDQKTLASFPIALATPIALALAERNFTLLGSAERLPDKEDWKGEDERAELRTWSAPGADICMIELVAHFITYSRTGEKVTKQVQVRLVHSAVEPSEACSRLTRSLDVEKHSA